MRQRRRLLLNASAIGTLAIVAACSGADKQGDDSIRSAHVQLAMFGADGSAGGTCSGVLVSPTRVLTAGHCVVGKTRWKVTSPGAETSVVGSKAYAYDWRNTAKSQPTLHDLAIVMLDSPILLKEYPRVATKGGDVKSAIRMRRTGGAFEPVYANLTSAKSLGFGLHYAMKLDTNEKIDSGAAVMSSDGTTVLGVVHGKGTTTGTLYVTRTDSMSNWIVNRMQCTNRMAAVTTQIACYKSGAGICLEHGPDCPNSRRDAGAARADGSATGTGTGTSSTGSSTGTENGSSTGANTGTGEGSGTGAGTGSGTGGTGGESGQGGTPGSQTGGGNGAGTGSGDGYGGAGYVGGLGGGVAPLCDAGNKSLVGICYGSCGGLVGNPSDGYTPGTNVSGGNGINDNGAGTPGTTSGGGTSGDGFAGGGGLGTGGSGTGGLGGSPSSAGSPGTSGSGGFGTGDFGSGSGTAGGFGTGAGFGAGFGTGSGDGTGTSGGLSGSAASGSSFGVNTGGGFGAGTAGSGAGTGAGTGSGDGFGNGGGIGGGPGTGDGTGSGGGLGGLPSTGGSAGVNPSGSANGGLVFEGGCVGIAGCQDDFIDFGDDCQCGGLSGSVPTPIK